MKQWIGIDPGVAAGAIAVIQPEGVYVEWIPKLGKELDVIEFAEILRGIKFRSSETFITIEKVAPRPPNGRISCFKLGEVYGAARAISACLGLPMELVTPKQWMGDMLKGRKKEKEESVARAKELFPYVDLSLKKDHNKAEALLIAEWGRRVRG